MSFKAIVFALQALSVNAFTFPGFGNLGYAMNLSNNENAVKNHFENSGYNGEYTVNNINEKGEVTTFSGTSGRGNPTIIRPPTPPVVTFPNVTYPTVRPQVVVAPVTAAPAINVNDCSTHAEAGLCQTNTQVMAACKIACEQAREKYARGIGSFFGNLGKPGPGYTLINSNVQHGSGNGWPITNGGFGGFGGFRYGRRSLRGSQKPVESVESDI